jgi:hypothetical protein
VRRKELQRQWSRLQGTALLDAVQAQAAVVCIEFQAQRCRRRIGFCTQGAVQEAERVAVTRRELQSLQCTLVQGTARRRPPQQHGAAFTGTQDLLG